MMNYVAVALAAALCAGFAAAANDKAASEDVKKAQKLVDGRLAELKANGFRTEAIANDALPAALPGHHFFFVLFPQYPVGRMPPKSLKVQNLFVVNPKDELKVITDAKGLEEHFKGSLSAAKGDKEATQAALAWLRLAESLHQDGFYTFEVNADSTKVTPDKDSKMVVARSVAMKGGNGDIKVWLTFDADGKLMKATEKAALKPGPRPICHATKLLDADPVMRAIVEQDLLIMGRSAKPYLDEQRAKASPQLQQAIDRIWERIQAEK